MNSAYITLLAKLCGEIVELQNRLEDEELYQSLGGIANDDKSLQMACQRSQLKYNELLKEHKKLQERHHDLFAEGFAERNKLKSDHKKMLEQKDEIIRQMGDMICSLETMSIRRFLSKRIRAWLSRLQ